MKISDYTIPNKIIKIACESRHVPFIDLNIQFVQEQNNKIENGILFIKKQKSLKNTYLQIVQTYLLKFDNIYGINAFDDNQQKSNTINKINKFINKLFIQIQDQEVTQQRLYQYPLVWSLLKGIICPLKNAELNNIKIITSPSVQIDVSQPYKKQNGEIFIYLNQFAHYGPFVDSHILLSAIKVFGIQQVLCQLKQDLYLFQKIKGSAQIYYQKQVQVQDFLAFLFSNIKPALQKQAQMQYPHKAGNFWLAGGYQQMLENVRHPHMQVKKSLDQMNLQFNNKLKQKRKEKGRNGLSLQALLKLKNQDNPKDKNTGKLIQTALGSDRVEK